MLLTMCSVARHKHFIVRLSGGLGNQMFQYAFGLALAHRGARVEYDLSWFDEVHRTNLTVRDYELALAFNLSLPLANRRLIRRWSNAHGCKLMRAIRYFAGRKKKTHICEQDFGGFGYHPEVWTLERGYLEGYWQSLPYLNGVEDTIRRQFAFTDIIDNQNRQYLEVIHGVQAVAVHVRRGDYLSSTNGLVPLSAHYYHQAINILARRVSQPVFFIFSDDIPWARDNLGLTDAVFIQGNEGAAAFRDMQLMSQCRHVICANSSFSWWAAWLNPFLDKKVIIPADYGQPDRLCAQGWTRLETQESTES